MNRTTAIRRALRGRRPGHLITALITALVVAAPAAAAPTDLDLGWAGDGTVELTPGEVQEYFDVVQDASGRVIAVGSIAASDGSDGYVERRTAGGILDPTFHFDGIVRIDLPAPYVFERAWAVTLDSSGRLYVGITAGDGTGTNGDIGVVRLHANGTRDTTFGAGGLAPLTTAVDARLDLLEFVNDIAVDASGRVVVTGRGRGDPGGTRTDDFLVARFLADGTPDTAFGGAGVVLTSIEAGVSGEEADALALQGDGKLLAAGETSDFAAGSPPPKSGAVVRYLADGQLDTGFGTGGKFVVTKQGGLPGQPASHGNWSRLRGVVALTDGSLLIAGTSGTEDDSDMFVARLTSAGAWDTTFGSGGATLVDGGLGLGDYLEDLVVQPDGSIVLAGASSDLPWPNERYRPALVRLHGDGTLDTTFGTNGVFAATVSGGTSEDFRAIARQTDGKLIAAGHAGSGLPSWAMSRRFLGGPDPAGVTGPAPATAGLAPVGAERLVAGGGSEDDVLVGGPGRDVLRGLRGDDRLFGEGGDDDLFGGPGDDRLFGGPGRDRLEGEQDDDLLVGGPGRDVLLGGGGNDRLSGLAGNDRLVGGPGNDVLSGGDGNDVLDGGQGRNALNGGNGNDVLTCGSGGPGAVVGGGGADRVRCANGVRDVVRCGAGRDVAIVDRRDVVRGCERIIIR